MATPPRKPVTPPLRRVISGGQTGADRAALDACLELGFPCGGFCPEGRLAEDGAIAARYPLDELAGAGYRERTLGNVRSGDGTVVFHATELHGGTALTASFCAGERKPCLLLDIDRIGVPAAAAALAGFIGEHRIETLNVAGPRQSECARIYPFVHQVVHALLSGDR